MNQPTPLLPAWTTRQPLALIVDRDAETRKLFTECLTLSQCSVEEAADGREALAKAIARQPDIIVTETRLPGIDGLKLCEVLRRDATTCDIPILCVTGDVRQVDGVKAAGADTVLLKPCLPDTLLDEVHRLLDRSRELRHRARAIRDRLAAELQRARPAGDRADRTQRTIKSRTYQRLETTEPPAAPPMLVCPQCDRPLRYLHSNVGGVSARHPEQWDYFECGNGCGTYQYRQRTRKLRKISL